MQGLVITTSHNATTEQIKEAKELAIKLEAPYFPRNDLTIEEFLQFYTFLLIIQNQRIILKTPQEEFFFHPNMAKLRINNLEQGKPDYLLESLALAKEGSLLDCTLGLGSDAITASYWLGEKGQVTALESVDLIYEITSYGLRSFTLPDREITQAMRRIKTVKTDYYTYLENAADKSFDTVYFDPMFDQTVAGAASIFPLRHFAKKEQISIESIREAKRVARKRVVMKARKGSGELTRLGFPHRIGGKYSQIHYGIFLL